MFGRRFAYQAAHDEGGEWERQAHHGHPEHHGHHGWGWHGHHGWGRGRRFFGRGDLKFALLELLTERPMHGYEMMKELQERSGGMYTASAGSVYPTLQMLEDRDFVTVSETDGKKVYTITDAGRTFLAENQAETDDRR